MQKEKNQEKIRQLYNEDMDFRIYVDKYAKYNDISLESAFDHVVVIDFARDLCKLKGNPLIPAEPEEIDPKMVLF